MSGGLVAAMVGAYRAPRAAMALQLARGPSEPRVLVHLMLACFVLLVASLPGAVRRAQGLAIDDPLTGAVAAHAFGYLFVAPLLFYGFAALVHLVARGFGGRAGFLGARAAVFWSVLLAAPITLAVSLAGVLAEVAAAARLLPWLPVLGYAGLALWCWLFAASLAEAEGFTATHRVAVVLVAAFAGLSGTLAILSGGVPVPA